MEHMGCIWDVYGMYMGCIWDVYGMYMGCIWDVYGMYMGCIWDVYGMYMGCIWDVYGMYMGCWGVKNRDVFISRDDHFQIDRQRTEVRGLRSMPIWPRETWKAGPGLGSEKNEGSFFFVMCSLFLSFLLSVSFLFLLFSSFLFFSLLFLRFFLSFLPSSFLSFPVSFISPFLSVCLSAFVFLLGRSSLWTLAFFGVVKPTRHVVVKECKLNGIQKRVWRKTWQQKSVPSQQLHEFNELYLDGFKLANSLKKWFTRCLGLGFISVANEWIPLDTLGINLATSRRPIPPVSNRWNQGVTGYYCHLLSQHIKICPNTHILSYTYLGSITTRAIEENGLCTVRLQVS